MKLTPITPSTLYKEAKAQVHLTGKLGFTDAAAKRMSLHSYKAVVISINTDDPGDKNLYVQTCKDATDTTFKLLKSGKNYSLNIKDLLDHMKIDYTTQKVIYNITNRVIDGVQIWAFNYSYKPREANDDDTK